MTEAIWSSWEDAVQHLRNQPEHLQLVKDCFYDDPLIEAAKRFHTGMEWAATRKLTKVPAGQALDIGAGRGIASFALARDGWRILLGHRETSY